MPSRMIATFPKGTEVIYNKDDRKYFGEVRRAHREEGVDFFSYDVRLTAQLVFTGDPRAPTAWIPIKKKVKNVSDYSLEFPPEST